MLSDIASVYGVQFANYVLPLVTVPYLSRVLGPTSWGLFAMAQAFAMYGGLVVDYGFIYYATRRIATAIAEHEISEVVAGVSGARLLLSLIVMTAAFLSYLFVPLFHQHGLLLWSAVLAEVIKAFLPNYYFYGVKRIALASLLDISPRLVMAAGILIVVHTPRDLWRVFALQIIGSLAALLAGYCIIHSRYPLRRPNLSHSWQILRQAGDMFLFRSAYHIYSLGNAFILGLFAPIQAVGYYSAAEKINSAAVGLLSPLSTALFPRAAELAATSMPKAARLTKVSLYVMGALSLILGTIMWFGSPLIVRLILGPQFGPSTTVLKILSLRSPFVAWTNVLGFQWLLALGLEKPFQKVTTIALLLNVVLAICIAPRYTFNGMAWSVVISQGVAVAGIYIVLRRRKLSPFNIRAGFANAL